MTTNALLRLASRPIVLSASTGIIAVRADAAVPGTEWIPPAHAAPAFSPVIDSALASVALLSHHRFAVMAVCMLAIPAIIVLSSRRGGREARMLSVGLAVILAVGAVGNVALGPWWTTMLVYRAGIAGSAVVTGSRTTETQYNNQVVRTHDVLIRTPGGSTVQSSFESDDFNVYPPQNKTYYPGIGDRFTVRYLEHAPRVFVIVANDDSPWSRGRRCAALTGAVEDATRQLGFAPGEVPYQAQYDAAVKAARVAQCGPPG